MRDERLRNDSVYATKTELDDVNPLSDRIVSSSDPNKGLIINNGEIQASMDINMGQSGEIYKFREAPAQYGISLISRNDGDYRYVQKDQNTLDNVLPPVDNVDVNQKKIVNMAQGTLSSDAVTKSQLDLKKDTGTLDTKIQNATAKTAISCDTDRYISIKSNGNKLADMLEDEQNQGFTLLTNNKRLNLVSTQPQTFYHNSGASLYNFKYTDDGNAVAGQMRFGQIQLAPSNTTNLNPALTLSSSRVNGLGTAASIYCDSAYGQSSTPLILSAQSLTDASANQLQIFRSSAVPSIKNQFTGKTGYSSAVAITEAQQFTTKAYTDTAVAAKLDISGGSMTGPIVLAGQPELSTHAVNRDYVDQVENSLVKKSGSTMTGDLILSGHPTSDLMAATKKFVDDAVATVSAGTTSELADANSADGNIYRVKVSNNQVEFYRNDTDLYLNLFGSTNGLIFDTPKQSVFLESSLSNATEMNFYRRPRAGTAATASIPQFRIQQTTFASSGLQYTRLSTQNMGAGNETAIIMYPDVNQNNSLVNRVTFNQRVGYQEDVNTTAIGISDYTLLCKQMADELYAPITDATAGSSISNGSNIILTAQATDVTVVDSTDTDNGYLVLTNRSIRNDNGTALFLSRGDTSLVLVDEAPLGEKKIVLNQPLSYESGSVGNITRDEEIPSRLMCDGRYRRQDQDIDLNFANRIRGLPSPLIPSEPVTLGMFDAALLYFRQCVTFGFTVLEVPSSPEAFASDANAITNITYTETGAGVSGYYTLSVNPALFDGSDYVVTCQWASTRSGVSIVDSQVAPLVVGNYQRTSFTIYARDTTGGTQQNQILGTLTRRGW